MTVRRIVAFVVNLCGIQVVRAVACKVSWELPVAGIAFAWT